MKERIVIDEDFYVKHFQEREIEFQEEDMCSGGNPEEWWHYKKEQVPETWEDLKELCRNNKIQNCSFASNFVIKTQEPLTCYEHIYIDGIYFAENGAIFAGYENDCISSDRTPEQMWQIIKSLVEEKQIKRRKKNEKRN